MNRNNLIGWIIVILISTVVFTAFVIGAAHHGDSTPTCLNTQRHGGEC
jgi:hypothetical protein